LFISSMFGLLNSKFSCFLYFLIGLSSINT
jgi:hypothetical protein